ncbi:hypothetical protein PIB30_106124 [Stylosanthes scabra]|uniref:Uncharacterized protein n=1 Tax=Stylosanthes scabra TaxID=79078 RepID=A0ABU6U0T7_9FABA|nr:hypothetical protein [Stylosanthes scabra]
MGRKDEICKLSVRSSQSTSRIDRRLCVDELLAQMAVDELGDARGISHAGRWSQTPRCWALDLPLMSGTYISGDKVPIPHLHSPSFSKRREMREAPIDARFAATRSSCRPLSIYHTCNIWYVLELDDQCPQAWVSPVRQARNWRIGGGNGRLNMRTEMYCAWMLDGATKDRVYALSLASNDA